MEFHFNAELAKQYGVDGAIFLQLERIINGLKEAGALLAGNFSEDRTDRTRWYALADCILEVYGESDPPISRNGEM